MKLENTHRFHFTDTDGASNFQHYPVDEHMSILLEVKKMNLKWVNNVLYALIALMTVELHFRIYSTMACIFPLVLC